MTTEQMDWIDDQNRKREEAGLQPPRQAPWEVLGTCDWGNCNRIVTEWRWAAELETWLPVCNRHRKGHRTWFKKDPVFKRGGRIKEQRKQ